MSRLNPSYRRKILFVCSRNRRRSLTAEEIFKNRPGIEVRSAGTQPGARIVISEGLIGWADLIVVMEKSHRNRIMQRFPGALDGKQVVALHLPDDFEFMQPELVDELQARVEPLL